MNVKLNKLVLAIGAMIVASGAMAATDSANLTVGASVSNACSIGAGALNFGDLTLLVNGGLGTTGTAAGTASQTVPVVCTNGASAAVTAGLGLNAAVAVRKMISGSDLLTYELYTTADRDTILNSSNSISYTGTGSAQTVTIYGKVTAADMISAKKGTYADTVALTITYTP